MSTPRDSDHRDDRRSGASPEPAAGGSGPAADAVRPSPAESTQGATAGPAAAPSAPRPRAPHRRNWFSWKAMLFLAPALIALGALVLYPILYTIVRSFFDVGGNRFVGLSNYKDMFTSPSTLTSIKNNVIWVLVAPMLVTALGLVFAVLTERVSFSTAFKVAVFMPMAISFLSTGVIWRLVYQDDPNLGLANAALVGISKVFRPPGAYPTARPAPDQVLKPQGEAYVSTRQYSPGGTATLGLVAIPPRLIPDTAQRAKPPTASQSAITGTVWVDFTPGGGGKTGEIDPKEKGLPSVKVEALSGQKVVASAKTAPDGTFALKDLKPGSYTLRLADSNFRAAWGGILWLGPTLVTPSIIISYIWIWAGFAMVLIAAGLAAIPRDVLEAARVDGANEWQVFRRITGPLLAPVLLVVFVTLVINVLKVFDLVLVIPPGSVQDNANVIALEMWRVSFGGGQNQGLGSALAILLFMLVLPAMLFNLRRFRSEQ